MAPRIIMLLGRTVWTRDAGGWRHETINERAGMPRDSIARLTEVLSDTRGKRIAVIFEPDGMVHQAVETPKVSRAVFATLARVRSEHSVVESENLGWGIEYPDAGPSGTYTTLIHSELTPGLIHLWDSCIRPGCRLTAAWSAYTVAAASANTGSSSRPKYVLILAAEFAAVAVCAGGRRSFKAWTGPMTERDWKTLSALIGDIESSASPSLAESAPKRGSIVVIADGDPEPSCPIWRGLRASGRVEAVLGMDDFAAGASRIPANHPANLAEAFPRPRELDRLLSAAAILGFSATFALISVAFGDGRQLRFEGAANRLRAESLERRLRALGENEREMARLRKEAPDGAGSHPAGRHDAIAGLSAAIPDALTLTALSIERDGAFELEALVVGPDFDAESTRRSLERCGFEPALGNGWTYDATPGKLFVRGKLGDPRQ
jgi:hypothetical protein